MSVPEPLPPDPQPVEAHRVGEDSPDAGLVGLRAAKRWLDRTTRATTYTSQDRPFRDLLAYRWPHSDRTFSYDIGGSFRGGNLDSQSFLGEVKKYKADLRRYWAPGGCAAFGVRRRCALLAPSAA